MLSTAAFELDWGVLPHSDGFPRIVKITAYDSNDNPLIDEKGKQVEKEVRKVYEIAEEATKDE